jgi:predicted nuclease with TOPRIM domain
MFKQIAKLIALLTWLTLMAGTAFAVRSSEQKKPNAYQQKLGEMESKGKLTEKQRQMLPDGKVETLSTMYDELFNLMKLNDAVFFQPDDRVLLKREVRYIYPKPIKNFLQQKLSMTKIRSLKILFPPFFICKYL